MTHHRGPNKGWLTDNANEYEGVNMSENEDVQHTYPQYPHKIFGMEPELERAYVGAYQGTHDLKEMATIYGKALSQLNEEGKIQQFMTPDAERINTYGQDSNKWTVHESGSNRDFIQALYLVSAGLDPFQSMGNQGLNSHSAYHIGAREDAIEAGWIPGDGSEENMAIANRFADEADALVQTDPQGFYRNARPEALDTRSMRIPQTYFGGAIEEIPNPMFPNWKYHQGNQLGSPERAEIPTLITYLSDILTGNDGKPIPDLLYAFASQFPDMSRDELVERLQGDIEKFKILPDQIQQQQEALQAAVEQGTISQATLEVLQEHIKINPLEMQNEMENQGHNKAGMPLDGGRQ